MNNFKELVVWQKSIKLVEDIYHLLNSFPKEEQYGLNSQIKRCAISIASNIAEGAGRNSKKEFKQFLSIALGSTFELETQLIISNNLNYIKIEKYNETISNLHHIQNMIVKLKNSLNNQNT